MTVIALTGHMGSIGNIGTMLARSLGYRLVDRDLVREAAAALGWSEAAVEEFDEKTGGLGRKMMEALVRGMSGFAATESATAFGTSYQEAVAMPSSERYMETLRAMIESLADEGDVIIVGRGAQAILASHPDTVHVRVACPVEERARRVAVRTGIDVESALERVLSSDREREAWHKKYFGIDYRSPYHYSLVVNSGEMSEELATHLIEEVVIAHQRARMNERTWARPAAGALT